MAKDNCPYGPGGRHLKGLAGCGCSQDPERKGAQRDEDDPEEGTRRKHVHVYETVRIQEGPVTKERQGLRWIRTRTTFHFQKCNGDGCPKPDRVVPQTEVL